MSSVSFQNPGLIAMEAVTTMGVNVKETSTAIGFFGTGLKYAIASLLRTGQHITIFRGTEKFSFSSREAEVRGKPFGFIYMNEERLGFTTHLGSLWEPWQIFREIYSNCLDEAGTMELRQVEPEEGLTTIVVSGEAFFEAALKKQEVFLQTTPLATIESTIEIHPGRSNVVYYRGVRAGKLKKQSNYTYNILGAMDLTEDRTFKSEWMSYYYISWGLQRFDQGLETVLTDREGFEFNLEYGGDNAFHEKVLEIAARVGPASVAPIALAHAEQWSASQIVYVEAPLSRYEKLQIESAKSFLSEIGFPISAEIFVVPNLGSGTLGCARNGKIFLAKATIDKGGNWLAGTILEEHLHITQGFSDESREFQNFLLDLVMKFANESQTYLKALEAKDEKN